MKDTLEKQTQCAIDELNTIHKVEIDSKIEEINILKSKHQQCIQISNQLKNLSEKRESDYLKVRDFI